jgi:heme-degrading monooxygenase HmoA
VLPTGIAKVLQPPYYAVIFTSKKQDVAPGYDDMAAKMEELAAKQPGYLGVESARGQDGIGITVSYWSTLEAVAAWKANTAHKIAQEQGLRWYEGYAVRIVKVERAYSFVAA